MIVGGGIIGTMHALQACRPGVGGHPPRGRCRAPPGLGPELRAGLGQRPGPGPRAGPRPPGPTPLGRHRPALPRCRAPTRRFGDRGRHRLRARPHGRGRGPTRCLQPDVRAPRRHRDPRRQSRPSKVTSPAVCGAGPTPWSSRVRCSAPSGPPSRPPATTTGFPADRPSMCSPHLRLRRAHRDRPPGGPVSGVGRRAVRGRPPVRDRGPDRRRPRRAPLRRCRLQMMQTAPDHRAARHRRRRRRLDALLPGLRSSRTGVTSAPPAGDGRVGHAAPARPAGRRRTDHRRHPRLRRALRLRGGRVRLRLPP